MARAAVDAGRGAAGGGGGRGAGLPAGNDFRSPGRVFNWDDFQALKDSATPLRFPQPDGSLFVGDKGLLTTGTYGDVTRLIPVEKMKDYRMPPPMLTRSPGHMRDFVRACKGGDAACSNFEVSAPFVEWMLLGVFGLRHEGKLEYDPEKNAVHQQRRGEQAVEAKLPARGGSSIRSRGKKHWAADECLCSSAAALFGGN